MEVPDVAAEVEVSSKRRKTAPKDAANKRSLRRKEKIAVADTISKADINELAAFVLQQVDSEQHLNFFPQRREAWDELKLSDAFLTICECFRAMYNSIYKDYFTGADKYGKFQLKWYMQCSSMLLVSDECEHHSCLSEAAEKWTLFKDTHTNYSLIHLNCLMISIQSAIFKQLAKWVAQGIPVTNKTSTSTTATVEEPDDVFYRFGGAAIAEMLHKRYRSIYASPYAKRSKIALEITILKSMECKDKSIIPSSLQYRDRGFMYFPDPSFIPFIKAVDDKVRSIANSDNNVIKNHGSNIIAVASEIVKADSSLPKLFENTLGGKIDCMDGTMVESISAVYSEFTRKLYNTRLAEFIDSYRQKQAAEKGSASLSGQNLRDSLLSQHANLKSTDIH